MESLTVWVLAAMVTAWLHVGKLVGITPKDVAKAIATASTEKPLPFKDEADRRTAALITAVGVFESGYNNQAKGDCKDKPPGWPGCGKKENDSVATSFCFMQVHFPDGVERVKGYTKEELLADPLACARAGREIMRDSLAADPKDPLKSYAGTSSQARRRFELAQKLFKDVPYTIRCD
jgi:hypothetical protein